jgi:sterol desaturase/sphingolipid hydroxylase (fatty acid hydroxylase superfamily)
MELAPRGFRLTTAATAAVLLILAAGLIAGFILVVHFAAIHPGALAEVPSLGATIKLGATSRWLLGATIWAAALLMWSSVLQRLLPVDASDRTLSRGLWFDALWYGGELARQLTWMPLYFVGLVWIKRHLLGNLELIAPGALPRATLLIAGILAGDFLAYGSHIARHRFDFLWNFHAVHHSQKELNLFTQHRFHDLDTFVDLAIRTLPLMLLTPGLVVFGVFNTVALIHFRLYHCPIRSNYGPLRYILVTPQSHRIHHASDPRLQNSNFGIFFSVWDHIFGTQHRAYDQYEIPLGLQDSMFPVEQDASMGGFAAVYAAQLVYPFVRLLRVTTSEPVRELQRSKAFEITKSGG